MTEPIDFDGDWYGWRLRGRHLVSPDGQRISRTRLEGLLWHDAMQLRLDGFASRRAAEQAKRAQQYGPRIKVVVVPLADYRCGDLSAS
ncbi:phage protein [Lysobacter sp. A6]|uniref:Phage protein n=1 Tax=Noviluteimonas lactosilytica TaxID=2888523 RepID=A0ABS8JCY8_9GAMM|nr:DUF3653 domain-containing protein [Lysobacter lactosilyticus]MCC8361471.1 phage protein [Lysobacter lactosilyticus]